MRKLSFLVAFAVMSLVSTATFAQEVEETVVEAVAQQEEKVEIQVSELPEAVTAALAADFADYSADKAYKTTKDEQEVYWVVLSKEDANIKVLFDAEGKVIKQKENEL
ncbi:hypothetical protein UMM65_06060 [Aureibaculum sp. 2210JD6-5]|uniref:hypothetical protein n=1 Tax=Aureibaculum sp. 2210JD6-5 TaxID=3103957 RepID=UPI002AAE1B79|nr:hypothetical protein [Aureibaculum sp. 2210JD6-5]MDY7394797.1 hypothetical protein [Aureibaculum sp. 2210JD6-5]